jgi:LysR family transcriptional regulator, benzoate and cis,cis-muconate-responsive activator of ben and cat genes
MELRHLRYFVAVAEGENVSRAALKLHVSQPGLSRQVRDLEAELGFPLLKRTAKSVRLTAAGRVFLAESRAVLQRVADAVKAARAAATGDRGELHLGYAPSPTARILPPTLRAFQAAVPNVCVKLHDLSTEEMLAGLREGKLQMALLVQPTRAMLPGFRFEALIRDPLRLAVPPGHAFARLRSIPLARAAAEPWVALSRVDYPEYPELLAVLFAGTKEKPRIVEEYESTASLVSAVESGRGLAMVPQTLACSFGARLKLIPFSSAPEPLVIGALWLKAGLSAEAEQLLSCAKAAAAASRINTPIQRGGTGRERL